MTENIQQEMKNFLPPVYDEIEHEPSHSSKFVISLYSAGIVALLLSGKRAFDYLPGDPGYERVWLPIAYKESVNAFITGFSIFVALFVAAKIISILQNIENQIAASNRRTKY